METPVAFFVFNRPEATLRVLASIRAARPRRLIVVADGARPQQPGESERVNAVRRIIHEGITWPCDCERIYADANLGCRRRLATGLDEVFARAEQAIILEDDCLPHADFFPFCEELLARYRDAPGIAHIGGNNFQPQGRPDTYAFSRYNHIWGWATWRRAWQHYDVAMSDWREVRRTDWLRSYLHDPAAELYWSENFDGAASGRIQTWDYQWTYTLWRRDWLAVLPGTNLVQNIGFDDSGTHLRSADRWLARAAQPIQFPLKHPPLVQRDAPADRHSERTIFSGGPLRRTRRRIRSWLRRARLLRQPECPA